MTQSPFNQLEVAICVLLVVLVGLEVQRVNHVADSAGPALNKPSR